MRRTMLCAMLCVMGLSALSLGEPELRGSPDELIQYLSEIPPVARITGQSEVRINADQAIITLLVTVENKSLEKAIEKYHDLCADVTRRLVAKGIAEDQIRPARFITRQDEELFTHKTKNYCIANSIRVTVLSEKQMQYTAQLVDELEEIRFKDVMFKTSKESDYRRQALAKACDEVNAKKQVYEQSFGVVLTPCGFTETFVPSSSLNETNASYRMPMKAASSALYSNVQQYVQFDEVVFTAQVMVDYRIKSK